MFDAKLTASTGANGLPRCDMEIGGKVFRVTTAAEDVGGPSRGPHQHLGMDHIGFHVDSLDEAVADLNRLGVEFSIAPRTVRPGVKIAFIRAPDGVTVELMENNEP